jgi:predicted DNA-binding protein
MAATRTSSPEDRTERHRKSHKLVQTWVSPKMKKALDILAKSEGRTVANFVRRELSKITGIPE